ncbi:MAG: transglutaminase domain-containing protein [Clostridia bacterium]|nr:transglutaminase domain-containing protein [Clostridia bacterium]
MEELKRLQLNNRSLEEFDKLMNYHLDKIEELEIDEININSKLYNLISLCTNLKQLVVKGDLRSDVNKIFFNICNPENIETLVLESVKLPTNKTIPKFSNLSTISLNNINFSDLVGFFNKIPNPEKVIALNLTNVDFGKRSISICNKFENLKYLNIDNVKNCVFDSFDFINDNKKMARFEFYNNEIGFENVNSLVKGKYNKKVEVNIQTSENCDILNGLAIEDGKASLTVNTCDLEKAIDNVSLFKLEKLFIILGNNTKLGQYIKKFKKNKLDVILAVNDIIYFNVEEAKNFQDRLGVEFINVLESPKTLKISEKIQCYPIEDYIQIREEFEKIKDSFKKEHTSELESFNEIYDYFKNNIKYTEEEVDLKEVFVNKKSSYDYFALVMNSYLKDLGFEAKVIRGKVEDEDNHLWNQVKLNGDWYNFDLAFELRAKENKKFLQYVFKSNLLNDEQFYKTHTPNLDCKPEVCYAELQEMKKEIKKEQNENKVSIWKKIYLKMISIFKFNKKKALPAPDEKKE